jgi:FkbM family methyltransferase
MMKHMAHTLDRHTLKFDTSAVPEWLVYVVFEQEEEFLERLLSVVRPDTVFFDVGANFGLYTGFVGDQIDDGLVAAFEPYPPNVAALQRTVELNDLSNVSIMDIALEATSGTRRFESPSAENYATAAFERPADGGSDGSLVETRPADEIVDDGDLLVPNIVKIDVEGAESLVIDGMTETLQREECRHLFCELHPADESASHATSVADFRDTADDIISKIERLGFHVHRVSRDGQVHVEANKP